MEQEKSKVPRLVNCQTISAVSFGFNWRPFGSTCTMPGCFSISSCAQDCPRPFPGRIRDRGCRRCATPDLFAHVDGQPIGNEHHLVVSKSKAGLPGWESTW